MGEVWEKLQSIGRKKVIAAASIFLLVATPLAALGLSTTFDPTSLKLSIALMATVIVLATGWFIQKFELKDTLLDAWSDLFPEYVYWAISIGVVGGLTKNIANNLDSYGKQEP